MFSPYPIVVTERLILRRLAIIDEREIFTLRSDGDINKYLDRQLSSSIEDARKFINVINENIDKNNSLYWAITLSDKNIFVGTICLFGFSDENTKCEIGYELLTKFQGQGIMMEAAQKVVGFAFDQIKVKKIEAFFHRDNLGSLKLLHKLGFVDANFSDNADPDLVCFHLTNSIQE